MTLGAGATVNRGSVVQTHLFHDRVLSLDEVLVQSSGALDIAHLLSELMENATHFSPPDTRVDEIVRLPEIARLSA